MAQRVQVLLEDDLDGGTADETVTFGLDGSQYETDLSAKNAKKLRDALAPFIAAARKTSGTRRRTVKNLGPSTQVIRKWAEANGYKLSSRGRVPADVQAPYAAATE